MVVIQRRARPHFTKRDGPTSHSPPPIVPPRAITAGPRIAKSFLGVRSRNGSGRSATSYAGPQPPGTVCFFSSFIVILLLQCLHHCLMGNLSPQKGHLPTL